MNKDFFCQKAGCGGGATGAGRMNDGSLARDPCLRDLRDPRLLLAFGFGSGLSPRGPGTAGTVVGVGAYALLAMLPLPLYAAVTLLVIVLGVPLCGFAARRLGQHDHGAIVWDEIAGLLVTMLGAPPHLLWGLAGFGLFRLLDIAKPWPISWLDRNLAGGLGIMADDVLAGAAACALLWLLRATLHGVGA